MKTFKTKKRFQGLTGQQILDLAGSHGTFSNFCLFRMPDNTPYYVRLVSGYVVLANLDQSNVVARVSL